jgi:1-aminocyclopropane-1-carboxylate deaminase/D-cysteine desulfhydrase-like pyridoxal-dependent ACC family enzyme
VAELPLLRRFPALAKLPRASFGSYPTPVQRVPGGKLWLKRDDLSGRRLGGNKVRGLEWLLGGLRPRDEVLTVGPRGSTHALATARYAAELGALVTVVRWNQVMNPAARRVDALLRREARIIDAHSPVLAYAIAALRTVRGPRWIPAGGASRFAVLGHVNGALEFAEQVQRGECELPERVVVPIGSCGTAAGLVLGFHIAGLGTRVVGVRVAPTLIANRRRVAKLATSAASVIETMSGERLPAIRVADFDVEQNYYAGGYGEPLRAPPDESSLEMLGVRLDDTYSRKAFAAASAVSSNHKTLLWLTFDGRLLQDRAS